MKTNFIIEEELVKIAKTNSSSYGAFNKINIDIDTIETKKKDV